MGCCRAKVAFFLGRFVIFLNFKEAVLLSHVRNTFTQLDRLLAISPWKQPEYTYVYVVVLLSSHVIDLFFSYDS